MPIPADWRDRYTGAGRDKRYRVKVTFDAGGEHYLVVDPPRLVRAAFTYAGGPEHLVHLLSELPFEFASFKTLHFEWFGEELEYDDPSFGGGHFPHGWACAFRGEGHRYLVSRRWLDHGPWRVLRGPNDTTLVQFHELGLTPEAALAQAKTGHQLMGNIEVGGFLQEPWVYWNDLKGVYDARRRVLKIVVLGREVGPRELRDACAARRDNALGSERPIDNVAYVFLDPAEARSQLPRLWPYGLECWTIVNGEETRLDADTPPRGLR
ncbi:hypothetical protein [Streptomyces youssoufiensis]